MNAIDKVLLSSQTAILYKLKPGMPDPDESHPEGIDTRKRVPLGGTATHDVGFYYGIDIIRDHIGRNAIGFDALKKAEIARAEWLKGIKALKLETPTDLPIYLLARVELNKTLLETLGKNPQQEATDSSKTTFSEGSPLAPVANREQITWESILEPEGNEFIQDKLLGTSIVCVMAEEMGLKRSSWIPGNTCLPLVNELKMHGPMLILGDFGEAFYVTKATPLKAKIEGETIYYWEVGSKRVEEPPFAHSVVLIGAQKVEKTERVYFVNPDELSDPNSASETRRIFAISYTNLRTNICALNGMPIGEIKQTDAISYAYYNPSFKPTKEAST
jgi:hypothetical protein